MGARTSQPKLGFCLISLTASLRPLSDSRVFVAPIRHFLWCFFHSMLPHFRVLAEGQLRKLSQNNHQIWHMIHSCPMSLLARSPPGFHSGFMANMIQLYCVLPSHRTKSKKKKTLSGRNVPRMSYIASFAGIWKLPWRKWKSSSQKRWMSVSAHWVLF